MDFRDGLSAELPAPRDDEPGGLRDDILDELADHLACAYRRELLRGADAATARQRVLERFGDPAALARRLWFDAMKGKIMAQRILVVCCILLTAISLSLAFVMWNQAVHAQRLAAASRNEMQLQLHDAQVLQQKMLEQLQAISKSASTTKTPDWIPISFKLTQETPDGPPAVGVEARLGRGNGGASKESAIHRESDDKGMVDFGVVQPGDWEFFLRQPVKDGGTWITTGTLNVLLSTTIQKSIICPRNPDQKVPVSIGVDWPSDLADQGLAIVASFQHQGFTYQPLLHWDQTNDSSASIRAGTISVFCGPRPNRMTRIEGGGPIFWRIPTSGLGSELPDVKPFKRDQVYIDLPAKDPAGDSKAVELLPGNYRLKMIAVVRPRNNLTGYTHVERCELVALVSAVGGFDDLLIEFGQPPGEPVNSADRSIGFGNSKGVSASSLAGRSATATFEATRNQPNLWTVRLPDELTQAVRNKLKAETKK